MTNRAKEDRMKQAWMMVGFVVAVGTQSAQASVDVGDSAPLFKVDSVNGKGVFELTAHKGKKPVLLNIVNTWCSPCKWETPALAKMYAKYKTQIEFVTVVTPWRQDSPKKAAAFAKKYNVSWPTSFDEDGSITNLYEVEGVPTNCVVGANGKVLFLMAGGLTESSLESICEAVIKGEAVNLEPRPGSVKKTGAAK